MVLGHPDLLSYRPRANLSAASVRFFTPSFEKRCCTWNLTVFSESPSRSAICGLLNPAAISAQTSRSRGVSSPGAPAPREDEVSSVDLTDGREGLLWRFGLEREAVGAGIERRAKRVPVVVGREHEDLGRVGPLA